MVWIADATRMPKQMHAECLPQLFLDNGFAKRRCQVDGKPVAACDVRVPV